MLTVAYLANQFPSPVEPYVLEEIEELRRRGVRVVAGSVRKVRAEKEGSPNPCAPEVVLQPLRGIVLVRAAWLCLRKWKRLAPVVGRIFSRGTEGPLERLKALLHTFLGACYAVLLEPHGIRHIHVHHGYFGSWIASVAARLLGTGFSMTLHGSDLLLRGARLDVKLESCAFCLTVSEYNRQYILERYPGVESEKVIVTRLGVELPERLPATTLEPRKAYKEFTILAVGRLHAVKDHAFLVRACAQLRARNVRFHCWIAGEGPERRKLESMIRKLGLDRQVTLLGYVPREQMDSLYDRGNVVVLTSRSEGIPLVLMEAMARGKMVLAPAITGIPELVTTGKTGYLYEPGSMGDFVARLLFMRSLISLSDHQRPYPATLSAARPVDWVRHAARVQIRHNYNRRKNLQAFGDLFLQRLIPQFAPQIVPQIAPQSEPQVEPQTPSVPHENFVLQQI